MKIQFCDLCSESVPDADFSLGRAFRRQGRVICAACDSSMSTSRGSSNGDSSASSYGSGAFGSGDSSAAERDPTRLSAGVGPGSRSAVVPAPAPAAVAAPPVPSSVPRPKVSAPGWTSVLSLILVLGGGYYLYGEVQSLHAADSSFQGEVGKDLGRLDKNLDTVSLKAQRRVKELEDRLAGTISSNQESWKGSNQTLQTEIATITKHISTLDTSLARLEGLQKTDSTENGRRLDGFLAESMRLRVELRELSERLERAEGQMGSERNVPLAAAAVAPVQKALPYAAHLVDLKSDVAGTRWNAVSALGETGDPEVVPHLIPHLKDSNSFVRMAVARVFGDLNSPLAIEPLIDALEDDEPVVREAAMQALRTISGRDFRFDPQAKESDRKKRVAAWRAWWAKSSQDFVGDL